MRCSVDVEFCGREIGHVMMTLMISKKRLLPVASLSLWRQFKVSYLVRCGGTSKILHYSLSKAASTQRLRSSDKIKCTWLDEQRLQRVLPNLINMPRRSRESLFGDWASLCQVIRTICNPIQNLHWDGVQEVPVRQLQQDRTIIASSTALRSVWSMAAPGVWHRHHSRGVRADCGRPRPSPHLGMPRMQS